MRICQSQLLSHTATTAPTSLAPMLAGLSQFHTAFPAQPSCVDKHQQCPNWAFAGQCELNQGFMKVQCAQSCDSCGWGPELTRTPRGLRWVRTGYAYQSPALGTYRRRRAACLQGSACCKCWVHVPASCAPRWGPGMLSPVALRVAPADEAQLMRTRAAGTCAAAPADALRWGADPAMSALICCHNRKGAEPALCDIPRGGRRAEPLRAIAHDARSSRPGQVPSRQAPGKRPPSRVPIETLRRFGSLT